MADFAHLHVHTEHSLLDGVPTMVDLVDRVVELGQWAVAVTDHGEVSGHLKLQRAALAKGVEPLFGMEGYFVDDASDRSSKRRDYDHITLLAVSQRGLENLWALSSLAYLKGMYYKPRIDWGMLAAHADGIVATGGCLGGCVASYLDKGGKQYDPNIADVRIGRFAELLGDRFYLELHTFPDERQVQVNRALAERGAALGVRLVAVSDSHYLRPEDWQDHELLIAAQTKKKHDDPSRYQYGPGALHVLSEQEVRERLGTHLPPDVVDRAIEGAGEVAEMASGVRIERREERPTFLGGVPEDVEHLQKVAWDRFDAKAARLGLSASQLAEYRERLERELDLILEKGYAGYFLILHDLISWARDRGILVGPGRGSSAGSLLAYALGITEVDPIRWGLLFERFLDPMIDALPDIDIDVPRSKRDEVLAYLAERYHVAGIGTLVATKPRLLLLDYCRVLGVPSEHVQEMSRIISSTPDLVAMNLGWGDVKAENERALEPWRRQYPDLFRLMDSFEAHYRHAGAHAAAVVVSRRPLMGALPLRKKSDDHLPRTQMEAEDVEALGYLKMDVLGLRTLDTLQDALDMARAGGSELAPFHEWQYEWGEYYEDRAAYEGLWGGRNAGIFQAESEGVSQVAARYRPRDLNDMAAVVAAFRRGLTRTVDTDTGLSMLELLQRRREGREPVKYRHPAVEPILRDTYGVLVYQEQAMRITSELGRFTPAEQGRLRKALGKKKPEVLAELRAPFVQRATSAALDPPVTREAAEAIWADMERLAEYTFNKSHALSYGMIALWCAWMKARYPAEFLTALFRTDPENAKMYGRECRRLGVQLLGPDLNESEADFALVGGRIRYGLRGVKFVGNASEVIQRLRPFHSVGDALARLREAGVTRRPLEPLILVGAFDSLVTEQDRLGLPGDWSTTRVALWLLWRSKVKLGKREAAALDEAGILEKRLPEFEEYAERLRVDDREHAELEYLGDNVTTLPFGRWLPLIMRASTFPGYGAMRGNQEALLGGTVREVRRFKVRKEGPNKGREMCHLWIEYPIVEGDRVIDIDSQQVVVFPKEYQVFGDKIEEGVAAFVKVAKLKGDGGLCLQKLFLASEV